MLLRRIVRCLAGAGKQTTADIHTHPHEHVNPFSNRHCNDDSLSNALPNSHPAPRHTLSHADPILHAYPDGHPQPISDDDEHAAAQPDCLEYANPYADQSLQSNTHRDANTHPGNQHPYA